MAIQVNIFEAGSVPTAQELVTLINELNTTLDESVTLTGEQSITGVKTFLGSKLIKFKQSVSTDKLGFTLYDYQSKEVGNFEYDNKSNFRLLALGNYVSAADKEVECNIGFKIYNKLQGAAYRLLCPLAGNAKNSIPSLTDTYTNFYMPLIFTNGAVSVTADNGGKVDLSTLIGSGSGDVSGLATVATTGDYNDLLNLPTLFSGNYNDLTNKPTLFSGSYGDLTDKPTLFSGDYNDLTNKPTIPVVDITKAQADGWYQPKGNYALATDLFSGSYNDLTDKPSLFSGSYNDLSDKPTIPTVPTISTNITSDATSDTKTASPKAVKDFVEGKGYLTQHQDISGKADQTDLEALEDRVEALEQGDSGSTDEDKYVKLVKDPANYLKASVGDIIKYNGTSTNDFIHGHDYECTKKGNSAYSVSSGDYVLDVAESATNEEFIAAMANEVKPFKYSENINWSSYIEYCATTNPNVILGLSTKTKSNLVVGDVLVSAPNMTPVSVVTEVSGSNVRAKLLSTGYTFSIEDSGGRYEDTYYSYIFTNPEDVKVVITDGDFLRTIAPEPYPPSININSSNIRVSIVGKGSYSGTGTNITIKKYYQSAEVAGTLSEWVEAKPCDCSDGGDTTQYSYLKLIPDLDAYTEGPVGEIVKYIGQTGKYTRGWNYEKVQSGTSVIKIVNDSTFYGSSQYRPSFPYSYEGKGTGAFTNQGYLNQPTRIFKPINDIVAGDSVMTWEAPGVFSMRDVTTVDTNYIYFGGTQVSKSAFSSQSFDIFKNETGGVCYSPSDSQNLINSQQVSNYAERVYFPENLGPKSTVVVIGIATKIGEEGFDIKQESEESISWEPILMPTESSIDSQLSQVSENALQNKVLYNELRITESGNGGTLEVVSYLNGGEPAELPVVDIDLNDCSTKKIDPEDPNNSEVFYVINGYGNANAYNLKNADGKTIVFVGQTPTLIKFNDTIDEGVQTVSEFGFTTDFGDIWNTKDPVGKFFVPSYTPISGYDETYYAVTGTTEIEATTRTISIPTTTVKSLKTKIAELEARIEQISAQLQS